MAIDIWACLKIKYPPKAIRIPGFITSSISPFSTPSEPSSVLQPIKSLAVAMVPARVMSSFKKEATTTPNESLELGASLMLLYRPYIVHV